MFILCYRLLSWSITYYQINYIVPILIIPNFFFHPDVDAEAEEVLNELNSMTEGENATILSSSQITNDGSDWSQTIGMTYFVLCSASFLILY